MENRITKLFADNRKVVKVSTFARNSGIPYGTLYDIAKGKTPIERVSVGVAKKLAEGFGMTLEELFGDEPLDTTRFQLLEIYAGLPPLGRKLLLAMAEAVSDVCDEEIDEALNQARYEETEC